MVTNSMFTFHRIFYVRVNVSIQIIMFNIKSTIQLISFKYEGK